METIRDKSADSTETSTDGRTVVSFDEFAQHIREVRDLRLTRVAALIGCPKSTFYKFLGGDLGFAPGRHIQNHLEVAFQITLTSSPYRGK